MSILLNKCGFILSPAVVDVAVVVVVVAFYFFHSLLRLDIYTLVCAHSFFCRSVDFACFGSIYDIFFLSSFSTLFMDSWFHTYMVVDVVADVVPK